MRVYGHFSILYNMHIYVYMYMDSTYRAMLRIVKAGCHLVAIAQVVEHC